MFLRKLQKATSGTLVLTLLLSVLSPWGNLAFAAVNDITLTNTNPAAFDGVNVPDFSTTITIATATDIIDGTTFDVTLPAFLPDIAAGDIVDGLLGYTVTGLGV